MKLSKIHIQPLHKGLLHEALRVPEGESIPLKLLTKAKASKDPALRKRATFALNARKWKRAGKKKAK